MVVVANVVDDPSLQIDDEGGVEDANVDGDPVENLIEGYLNLRLVYGSAINPLIDSSNQLGAWGLHPSRTLTHTF